SSLSGFRCGGRHSGAKGGGTCVGLPLAALPELFMKEVGHGVAERLDQRDGAAQREAARHDIDDSKSHRYVHDAEADRFGHFASSRILLSQMIMVLVNGEKSIV